MNRRRSRPSLRWLPLVLFLGSAPAAGQSMEATVISAEKINLRTGPGTEYAPETWIAPGERLMVLERVGEWTRVRTPSGRIGFVWDDFLAHSGAMVPEDAATRAQAATVASPAAAPPTPRPLVRAPTRPLPYTTQVPTRAPMPAWTTPGPIGAAASPSPQAGPANGETRDALLNEVALLRTEIEELKRGLAERESEATAQAQRRLPVEQPAAVPTAGGLTNPVASESGVRGVRTASVAIVSLGIGWLLGSTFTRRRSRSQKNRLRF